MPALERQKQMDLCYFVIRAGLPREVQFSHSYIVRSCHEKKKKGTKEKKRVQRKKNVYECFVHMYVGCTTHIHNAQRPEGSYLIPWNCHVVAGK